MTKFLIIVTGILGLAVVFQILRTFQLAAKLRGKNDWDVTDHENKTQALMMPLFMVFFFGFVIWQIMRWGHLALPESASVHGEETDMLLTVTWWIITPVFFITHILLFYFCYKFVYNKDRRADFYPHNNKLEMLWTIVPTIVLTCLIIYGLVTWNKIMTPIAEDTDHVLIELYGKQFDWTARYAGEDMRFGDANIRRIEGANVLGIDSADVNAADDKIVKGEFHLPVNKPVQFVFRSQDVIHSAYMPHFRAQMNCVPGMKTQFNFVPKYTTAEMREKVGNPEFDYLVLCNKICGAAHYNMQIKIVVESQEDYDKWLAEQATFIASNEVAPVQPEKPEVIQAEAAAPALENDSTKTE